MTYLWVHIQVKIIHLASERSAAALMRDAKEIEYVLKQVESLQAGGFAKETWKDSLASWIAFLDFTNKSTVNALCQ